MDQKITKEEIVAERLEELHRWLETNDPEPELVYEFFEMLLSWLMKRHK